MSDQRPILRFLRGRELVAAVAPWVTVYDLHGAPRVRFFAPDLLDVAPIGDEIWIASGTSLTRIRATDGALVAEDAIALDRGGRFLLSATAPGIAVWLGDAPAVLAVEPVRLVPAGAALVLPVDGERRFLWDAGVLRSQHDGIDRWRAPLGEAALPIVDGQIVQGGRLVVVAQRAEPELRFAVASAYDGEAVQAMRIAGAGAHAFAAARGLAVVQVRDVLVVIDLQAGRAVRELAVPEGATLLAVDRALERLAFDAGGALHVLGLDELARGGRFGAMRAGAASSLGGPLAPSAPDAPPEELPEEPLAALQPLAAIAAATPAAIAAELARLLAELGARVHHAIARAWDAGTLRRYEQQRLPFVDQVEGILSITGGHAPGELAAAAARRDAIEQIGVAARRADRGGLLPFDALVADLGLSPLAAQMLFAIAAPALHGDLARLYGILSNDAQRPVVDELLLAQLFEDPHEVARELDGAAPLRRWGLVQVGGDGRPFARLTADRVAVRALSGLPDSGEPTPHVHVRMADRDIGELQLPRALLVRALRYLAADPAYTSRGPARIVVRGRVGAGRHALLAALAARAGRALAIIDLAGMPRAPVELEARVARALRQARLRGQLPCLDGFELTGVDDPDVHLRLGALVRAHPGPLAVRLPADARVALDPGYLLLDLPPRSESERLESWRIAARRHAIDLPDLADLAARYRIGPGIVERVAAEVAQRPDRPATPAAWLQELDDTVRQHLENRLGAIANRVTRLASWSDIVLPEDITDSLVEMTSRMRHRKQVYEQWGFDRTVTTARGITALFQGTPGTGKTMVAGVIARDLGLELYRVDVSRITSKYIGETEKNLGSLFDAAEDGQVMLLFDEADSLFAKRTEVKTSVDRYSNMEVNYLLQRLDTFEGVAVLTTNFGNAIDPAFKRRLTYRVTFPFPDETMREQLWRAMLPPQMPIAGPLDFAALARRFRLSGGYIRNAVLRAAFLAAEEGTPLGQAHLERAIQMEYREIGKLAEGGQLE